MIFKLTLSALLSLSLVAVFRGQTPVRFPVADGPPVRGYLTGPGDKIAVNVPEEKEFSFEVRVGEDGMIRMPFSSTPIPAKCRTEDAITEDVRTALKKFLVNPSVSALVTERNSRLPVTVHGEVRQPSQIALTRRATLSNMLATALGPTEFATGLIQITRSTTPVCEEDLAGNTWKPLPGEERVMRLVSLDAMQKGGEAKPLIFPGDEIVLLRAAPVFINGEVVEPGARLIKERGLRLIEAIAQVGGLRSEAKRRDIKIYRYKPGADNPDELVANYDLVVAKKEKDVELRPYDIVVVGKTKDSVGMMIFKFAVGVGKQAAEAAGVGGGYKVTSF